MTKYIKCPFCGDDDFDLVGLKNHLEMGWCKEYNNTMTAEEELRLHKIKQKLEQIGE